MSEVALTTKFNRIGLREVMADAEHVRLVVQSVEAEATEMFADCAIDELRRVAAVVRTHTLGMMLSAAGMVSRAERLETIADVRELAAASVQES